MIRNRHGRTIAAFALLSAAIGCQDDQPDPTGDLERPSGLVLIERPTTVERNGGTEITVRRADLLIADSEAQGVRVQRFQETVTVSTVTSMTGTVTETLTSTSTERALEFVLGPTVYFPLVIPAEGFPSELDAVAREDRARAYVLAPAAPVRIPHADRELVGQANLLGKRDPTAPAEPRLYVLDVTAPEPLAARSTDEGNRTLGYVPLADTAGEGVPVDVIAWAEEGANTDRVAILYDDLDGGGRLVGLDVDPEVGSPQLARLLATSTAADVVPPPVAFEVPVGGAPRSVVRMPAEAGDPVVMLVAVAGGPDLAQVTIDGAVTSTRAVPGIGPTARIVPIDARRALALRSDAAAVVVLEADASGAFARSTRTFRSPYAPLDARGPAAVPGRVDLPQPATSGARGAPLGLVGLEDAADVGAVMLALLDGHALFLRADTLEPVVEEPSEVTLVRSSAFDLTSASVRECDAATLAWCSDNDATPDVCAGLVQSPRAEDALYRATFRGPLLTQRDPLVVLPPESDTALVDFEVDLSRHELRVGDEVRIQAPGPCVRDEATGETTGELMGEVVEVGAQLLVRFELGPQQVVDTAACGSGVIDVYPADDVVVLAEYDGGEIVEVFARAPVVEGIDGRAVARIETRPDGRPTPVAFTLVSTSTTFERIEAGVDTRPCTSDADCGEGRLCQETPASTEAACPQRCQAGCRDPNSACNPAETAWLGAGVELVVPAAVPVDIDLGSRSLRDELNSTEVVNAVPHETVWLPLWRQWITSFPGSRTLLRLEAGSESFGARVTR